MHFQQGEGPSRGLLRAPWTLREGLLTALLYRREGRSSWGRVTLGESRWWIVAGVWAEPRSGAREETDRKSGAAQVSPHKEITQTRIFSHGFIRYWSRLKVRFVKNQLLLRGPAAAICTPTHAGAALLQRYVTSHYSEANAFNNLWRHEDGVESKFQVIPCNLAN